MMLLRKIRDDVGEWLRVLTRPFFAYNKAFEERVLKVKFDGEISTEFAVGKMRKKKFAIKIDGLRDPFGGDGVKCVFAWRDYLKTGDKAYLYRILEHNVSCLVQELSLLVSRPFIHKA